MLVIGGAVGCDGCSAVCRRRGPYPEGVTTPKGHTLAFWQGGLTYGATKPEEPKWRRQAAERNSQARRLGPKVPRPFPFWLQSCIDHLGSPTKRICPSFQAACGHPLNEAWTGPYALIRIGPDPFNSSWASQRPRNLCYFNTGCCTLPCLPPLSTFSLLVVIHSLTVAYRPLKGHGCPLIGPKSSFY